MSNEEKQNLQDEVSTEQVQPAAEAAPEEAESTASTESVERQVEGEADTERQSTEDDATATEIRSDKQKRQKSVKNGGKTAEQKRKLFKYIYYPVLALFVALMLVFSAVDGVSGYSPSAYGDKYYSAVNTHVKRLSSSINSSMSATDEDGGVSVVRDYIVDTLTGGGFTSVAEVKTERSEDGDDDRLERIKTVTDWSTDGSVKKPTVTFQTSTLDADLQSALGLSEFLVGRELTNIVAALPAASAKAGAVIITVRYDSRTDSVGAANYAFVANAIQTLTEYAKTKVKLENDIIVVFTEDLNNSYGSYAFFNLFEGLDGAVARAEAGLSLDAYGNSGTLGVTDASGASLDYINAFTKASGNVFVSSVVPDSIPDSLINKNAVKAFGDIPALQVAVLGGLDAAQSPSDTADNVSSGIIKQQSQLLKDYIEKFGKSSDKYVGEKGDTVFFSYLDGGVVAYTYVAAYVVGGLVLAMMAAVVVTMLLKKTFSLKNMLIACGVQLLTVVSTLAAMVAAYFLVTLMLTGFGVLPIHAITQLRYSNAGIIIAAMFISVAASFGFTTLYKRLFRVTSSDTVRGTAMLFGLAGAVMSFACPKYSFMTAWLGILLLAVLLVSVCLHKKFKSKFGFGMDRLYLYAVPVALCLPLFMPEITMLAQLLPLALLPVLFTVFTAASGVAVPYLDRTQPLFDRLVKKLPNRTIRVEHTVTEKVEDRAKKGKFTEKTYRRVDKEKVPFNYKNYFGISVVAVLGIVIALFSGGFGVDLGKSITGYYSYNNAIYNDSMVYELTTDADGNTEQRIVVNDLMAYKFVRYQVGGFEWDGARGGYIKKVSYNVSNMIARDPEIIKGSANSKELTVTTIDGARSNVTLTIPSARSITKITIKESSKNNGDYEGYIYEFDNEDEIVLKLPYGFDNEFTMEIEGSTPTQIEYEEYRSAADGDVLLDSIDEWNAVRDSSDTKGLRAGLVIKRTIKVK